MYNGAIVSLVLPECFSVIKHDIIYQGVTMIVFFHLSLRCGLVALWMAAHLGQPQLSMETVVQTALSRGYTAQGEMFSGDKCVFLP